MFDKIEGILNNIHYYINLTLKNIILEVLEISCYIQTPTAFLFEFEM